MEPNHKYAFNNLGNAKKGLKDYQGAIDAYSKQLSINPNEKWSHYNRGISYELSGDLNSACADWKKAANVHGHKDAANWVRSQCIGLPSQVTKSYSSPDSNLSVPSGNNPQVVKEAKTFDINPLLADELRKCNGVMTLFCKNLRRGKFKLKR